MGGYVARGVSPIPPRDSPPVCSYYFFSVQCPMFHASEDHGEYSTLDRSGRYAKTSLRMIIGMRMPSLMMYSSSCLAIALRFSGSSSRFNWLYISSYFGSNQRLMFEPPQLFALVGIWSVVNPSKKFCGSGRLAPVASMLMSVVKRTAESVLSGLPK